MPTPYMMVIAPAKKLADEPKQPPIAPTQPRLLDESMQLAALLKEKSVSQLKQLMHISDALAELNEGRYARFSEKNQQSDAATAALATFKGDVYQKIDADSLSEDGWEAAEKRLRIFSGLYGLLRPTDRIQPYRLDMGTPIDGEHGKGLYEFWQGKLAALLEAEMQKQGAELLVNLASKEYFQSVEKHLSIPVVTVHFKEEVAGTLKTFGMNAKRARGMMVRYALEQRIDDAEQLKRFDAEDYAFVPEKSDDTNWLFAREKK